MGGSSSSSLGMSTIAGRRRRKRPQCPQCGSRKFRKDADTGFVVCWSGHILQGFREEEANDGEDFSASQMSQMRKRYLHKEKPSHASLSKKKRSTAAQGSEYNSSPDCVKNTYLHPPNHVQLGTGQKRVIYHFNVFSCFSVYKCQLSNERWLSCRVNSK